MYTHQVAPSTGEAFIAVRKNRIKTYPTNVVGIQHNVYLSDKQEFEIELFNPSTSTKLAKISINGKAISSSGVVLKPGQRSYIERYIDTPRKFLFETYEVENSSAALGAIQQNGFIEISFYDEYVPPQYTPICYDSFTFTNTGSGPLFNSGTANLRSATTTGSVMNFCSTAGASCTNSTASIDFLSDEKFRSASIETPSLKETGKVEQGAISNQKFTDYVGSFNSWTTNVVKIKLLPYSEKPLEMSELAQYCTQCGTKNKGGNYKFCPTCGTRF